MSARDDVLAAVRAALVPTSTAAGRVASGVSHGGTGDAPGSNGETSPQEASAGEAVVPSRAVDRAALVDLFAERVADYLAIVTRCAGAELTTTVAAALDGATSVVVPPGLALDVLGAVVDDDLTSAELDATAAVVTAAAVGIAETGTVVLDHRADQGRRAITLLPDLHVCIVHENQVVPDVPDALPRLDPHRPQTWISGPSATSDIELSRVEGVHGPRRLHVILVAD